MSDSEDEFIEVKQKREVQDYENNLAWGKKKDNYYQDDEDDYSEIQEEEDEAQNIINQMAEDVDDEDFALENKGHVRQEQIEDEEAEQNYSENIKMLKTEIRSILKRLKYFEGKDLEQFDNVHRQGKLSLVCEYVNIHQAYVMTMIMLMKMYQSNTPHLTDHSIMKRLQELKVLCDRFHNQEEYIKFTIEQIEQQQGIQEQQQQQSSQNQKKRNRGSFDQKQQNLEKYNELAERHKKIKKLQKKERRNQKISVLPSKPFQQIGENEARSINYTISKNKGLTRKRGKKPKSSRASNRAKYQKKMIKYRSAKPMYNDPGLQYGGQQQIKQGKIQSINLK